MENGFIKIITKAIIIVSIIVGIFLIFSIYTNSFGTGKNAEDQTEKIHQEIQYLDTKLLSLINYLNNIDLQNYKVTLTKVQTESDSPSNSQKNEEGSSSSEDSGENGTDKEETTISKMEENTIVQDQGETDWKTIEGELEILSNTWNSIVLDLYKINVNSESIISFSNNINEAIIAVKNQDKNMSAMYLSKLYSFLPEFSLGTKQDEIKRETLLAKSYIVNAYAYVQTDNWDRVSEEIEKARVLFASLVNDARLVENNKRYNVNKSYIVIEELKNSLSKKEKGVFYVKYKNALEELNIIS